MEPKICCVVELIDNLESANNYASVDSGLDLSIAFNIFIYFICQASFKQNTAKRKTRRKKHLAIKK